MNIYKCKLIRKVREIHYEYIAAPSLEVAKDRLWVDKAYEDYYCDGFLENPEEEHRSLDLVSVKKVNSLKEVCANWLDCLPWFHPKHQPLDKDAELKDYFKTKDHKEVMGCSIRTKIKDLEYEISDRQGVINRLKEELKKITS